jgi:DNA polymerase-3 subunit delta
MIKKNLDEIKESLKIEYEELNLVMFRDMPAVREVIDACSGVPFMSDKRLVILKDTRLLSGKGSKEEGKELADYLEMLPETNVLVMCSEGEPDKRRALYKRAAKLGKVISNPEPKAPVCVNFAIEKANKAGALLKKQQAGLLVEIAGCDYYVIENEVDKLAVYAKGRQITEEDIKRCVSRTLEYSSFELHRLFIQKRTAEAVSLLNEILSEESPEALVGLLAYNFREMYKVRSMMDIGYSANRIAGVLKSSDFIVSKRMSECRSFTSKEIRKAIGMLSETDYQKKSGRGDSDLMLPRTLFEIYKL